MSFNHMPSNWEVRKMPSVVKWSSGGTPKATEKQYYENGSIPWLVIGDLNDGIVTKSESKITKLGLENSSAKMIPKGTLLVAMYGSIGKLGITGIECCTNQAIAYAKELYGVTTEYLYYYMAMMKPKLISKGKGGTQKNISQSVLNSLDVIVPPLSEQKRIVARIEELFSELDNGVETLKKTKQQLAVYRQSVLKAAFAVTDAPFRRLEELCFFITKGTTPRMASMSSGTGEIPFIKVYNLTSDNSLDFSINPTFVSGETHKGFLGRSIVYPGDVLMNIVGPPMGKVSIVPDTYPEWNINQAIARFRCLNGLCNKYLAYFLGYSDTIRKMTSKAKATAGQFNLTLEICRDIQIPIPPVEKQKQIIVEIESRISVCDRIEKTVDAALQQAESMRQSILKKAFEGKL